MTVNEKIAIDHGLKKNEYKKQHIPKALREQVWVHQFGKKFEHSCYIKWCTNKITVFD